MTEKTYVTGEQVRQIHGDGAKKVWKQILNIGGFGDVPFGYSGGVQLAGLSDAKRKEIDGLLAPKKEGK